MDNWFNNFFNFFKVILNIIELLNCDQFRRNDSLNNIIKIYKTFSKIKLVFIKFLYNVNCYLKFYMY